MDASYLQSRELRTLGDLYGMGTGFTAVCDGQNVRCGSFAAPLYGEKTVLRRLNLRIDSDDRIALLGANGNGKSN